MELRHIRYFVRAAEFLHFTHAAESLYISQPTLSSHIQQLEQELGLPLFDRIGRNVRLTECGRIFFRHAVLALRELDVAQEKLAHLKGLVSGKLQIGALLVYGQEILPAWLSTFHAEYPQIQIEVLSGTSDRIATALKSGHIELALTFVPVAPSAEIACQRLFSDQLALIVSEKHPFAEREQVQLEELASLPLALGSRRLAARTAFDTLAASRNVAVNILVEIDDLQALLKIAETTKMGTILTRLAAAHHPNIRLINVEGLPPVDFGILWRADAALGLPATAFLEHIIGQCHGRMNACQSASQEK